MGTPTFLWSIYGCSGNGERSKGKAWMEHGRRGSVLQVGYEARQCNADDATVMKLAIIRCSSIVPYDRSIVFTPQEIAAIEPVCSFVRDTKASRQQSDAASCKKGHAANKRNRSNALLTASQWS
jgi:hypothetical protein